MAVPLACTRFSDNYDLKEELGKCKYDNAPCCLCLSLLNQCYSPKTLIDIMLHSYH